MSAICLNDSLICVLSINWLGMKWVAVGSESLSGLVLCADFNRLLYLFPYFRSFCVRPNLARVAQPHRSQTKHLERSFFYNEFSYSSLEFLYLANRKSCPNHKLFNSFVSAITWPGRPTRAHRSQIYNRFGKRRSQVYAWRFVG